ncbi:bifunctional alpha/beta hydrolase/OsmC family protein [Enterobacteriaceae bacterium H11S18]|uniref:bifunctional alpha/beta hydrolase/OsmC family protein n=1 Tax=Dryocola clanedunensis TaxID=2925396 RepID=UPI0022F13D0C|nr:bifunctional alpha/beta hydrolase/OsmC family protein [Dryocola clanedunensis]MCT4706717.1 bifunctional alpha/beta hydrolase/OsmC family protein [Dryocola clanedunensis]MCT4712246.1 bifunctional alpha/beta hydrolase/OsmC family protein [Dryocola clanedunensis]
MTVIKQKLTFANQDGITLSGLLESPENPTGYALFAHCFTCGKGLTSASQISRALVEQGIAVLRFDFTGLGGSDGDFANSNFSSNVADLLAAADYLSTNYQPPALLVGHSLGGTAVLVAALRLDYVKCVATIGAPAEPAHVLKQLGGKLDDIRGQGVATVQLAGRPFTIKKQFLDDVEQFQLQGQLRSLNKALLILHSPRDTTVSVDQAERLYTSARHPKSFISLDDADHLLSSKQDARYAANCIASWAERYMPAIVADVLPSEEPAKGEVIVTMREGDFLCDVRSVGHQWLSDEPLSVGGLDKGPTPYDQLLAALGTCTSMTLRMYARRKKLRLSRLVVRLTHSREHLEDCEDCLDGKNLADRIHREILIEGELSPEETERLEQIAELCPVHKTLLNHIDITTHLTKG